MASEWVKARVTGFVLGQIEIETDEFGRLLVPLGEGTTLPQIGGDVQALFVNHHVVELRTLANEPIWIQNG